MASTVKLPLLGNQSKGAVIGITIGTVGIGGYLLYRRQKKASAATAAAATATAASGYGYGASAAYGYGNGYYGYGSGQNANGGGSSGSFPAGYYGYGVPYPPGQTTGPVAYTTNAQWAQAAITQLENDGYDAQSVAGALGAYELGQPVNATQQGIIQAAIAIEGYPPVAGANGDPPGIKVQGTPGGGSGGGQGGGGGGGNVNGTVKGLKVTSTWSTGADIHWNPTPGATSYDVSVPGIGVTNVGNTTYHGIGGLKPKTRYTVNVAAKPSSSGHASVSFTTK